MALIGKIRNNPWIVLLFIGGGIALFIFSEMTNGAGGGPIGPLDQAMARIGAREVDRNDFERTLSGAFRGGDNFQNRDNLFNFYVSEGLIQNEADALGLDISEEEETELLFGTTPSPSVQNLMRDPQTGQINRQMLSRIQGYVNAGTLEEEARDPENQLNPQLPALWDYTARQAKANRLQEKMVAMAAKGMYAPQWQAQEFANNQLQSRSVAIVKIPFDEVDDASVTVEDADLQAFIDENTSIFRSPEESRTLSYVAFNVIPTAEDSAAIRGILNDIKSDWTAETTAAGDSLFAVANRGTYSPNYVLPSAIAEDIVDVVMEDLNVGEVYGPYVEGNAMKLVKLVDRKVIADSATVRQIVRRGDVSEARALVDSLKTVLERSPAKWSALAEEFSQDPFSSGEGGRLTGVKPGTQPRPVDNIIFRTGNVGQLYVVESPGTVTLVQVQNRSRSTSARAKLAYITEPIVPRSETEDEVLATAQSFLNGKNTLADVKAAAESAGMDVVTTGPLNQNTYALQNLGSGQEVRDIMCFAYGADKGDVSGIVYTFTDPQLFYENNYVIVGVEDVVPEGIAPVGAVRENLTPTVRNRKKGEVIGQAIAGKDLPAIAAQYGVEVDTVSSNLTLSSLPGIGREPKVVAAAAAVATGSQSAPIVGNEGVYVLVPINDAGNVNSDNIPGARQQLNLAARQQVINGLLAGLRSTAEVEDGRSVLECQQ